ncbi:hypothetical protein HIM_01611 [Hirsutella minnesotensis 3608]|nr:hypothetical protein HIM_01611 [Hirsutella minnesotensis 3608]
MGSIPGNNLPAVRVLIAGGSYAGLSTALNLLDLGQGLSPRMAHQPYDHHPQMPSVEFEISIIDERDGFYHLIGSPLALADADYARKVWVKFYDIPGLRSSQVKMVQGYDIQHRLKTAVVIDNTTKETTTHLYDYFVAATGLRRAWPVVPQSLTRKQYIVEVDEHIHAVTNARHGVVVVSGGAVGIEIAAELKLVRPDIQVRLIHSRDKLLSSEGLSDECKDKALELLEEMDVDVVLSERVLAVERVDTVDGSSKYSVQLTSGRKIHTSEVITALSKSVPSASYLPRSALDEEGYVKIEPNLRFVAGTPNCRAHFCAGDVARWSGIRRCGAAMHGGHFVAQNIHKSILMDRIGLAPSFAEFDAVVPPMMGLAVGKKAVASGPDGTTFGEDVMQAYFRDDLGFEICWNWMGLGGRKQVSESDE